MPDDKKHLEGVEGAVVVQNALPQGDFEILNPRELCESIIKATHDAILMLDSEGIICLWNEGSENIFGWTREEAIGKPVYKLLAPEGQQEAFLHKFSRFTTTGEGPKLGEIAKANVAHKDGHEFEIELSLSPVKIADKTGIVGIIHDITARKRNEEALKDSEARFRILFETSRDSLMTISPPSWNFTFANKATLKAFGAKDVQEFISHAPWELSPEFQPDGRRSDEKAKAMIETALGTGSHFFEWTHKRISGEEFPATVLLTSMEIYGQIVIQATVRDISDQKQNEKEIKALQEQFIQAQKMEAVGTLTGGIAHNFNNLLTIITGSVGLMKGEIDPNSQLYQDLDEIRKAAERAAELTRDLLAFGRKQMLQLSLANLNSVISEFMSTIKHFVGEDILIEQNFAHDLWKVDVDINKIISILANLVTNARHAMPKGGRLSIVTRNVHFDKDSLPSCPDAYPGNFVKVSVEDTGTGIPKDVLPKIFEPFFTTKQVGEGTGLGLSMIHGSVMQQKGFIDVETEVSNGTVFHLYFPASSQQELPETKRKNIETLIPGTETVLIVEDEESLRKVAIRILKQCGYNVLEASNAGIAFLKLKALKDEGKKVDLILTDIRMPEMNGTDMANNIEEAYPDTKIVFMSGYTFESDRLKGQEFIPKPFTSLELSQKIRGVLDKK